MASPQTQSSLAKIPAELRVDIFKLALLHDSALRVKDRTIGEKCPVIDVALLVALVNDHKYTEAAEVFYSTNIVRLTAGSQIHQLKLDLHDPTHGSFAYITHLEMTNFANTDEFLCFGEAFDLDVLICNVFREMPKLKSVTVAYDALGDSQSLRKWMNENSVKAMDQFKAFELECVGVGLFQVQVKESFVVIFKHYGLVQSWQDMKRSKALAFPGVCVVVKNAYLGGVYDQLEFVHMLVRHVQRISLQDWTTTLDEHRRRDLPPDEGLPSDLPQEQMVILGTFAELLAESKLTRKVYQRMAAGAKFGELDRIDGSAEVLEGMSNLLIRNSSAWPRLVEGDAEYQRKLGDQVRRTAWEGMSDSDDGSQSD
ncbi:hypothetical protein LTR27_013025 [Elasticomyces elasticus]|nr:hypothetical protein LTR27_013025 [Elasticomyces elasticus]